MQWRSTLAKAKVLLVDDEEMIRFSLAKILEQEEFDVTVAGNVSEALKHISAQAFDVLLSDLHMPGAGDGLTVVSAMRHSNPSAVTMLFTAFPAMSAATNAILLQADEVLVKPLGVPALVKAIKARLEAGPKTPRKVESVAMILARTSEETISDWYACVELQDQLMAIPMSRKNRTGHLPEVFRDLHARLLTFVPLGTKDYQSQAASDHGTDRFRRGYSAAMMVEESRILQVCIFQTLQKNLSNIDFSVLLLGVMTIADEVDSQLSQAMETFVAQSSLTHPDVRGAATVLTAPGMA
jgi:CheY-like chemotaxis protein